MLTRTIVATLVLALACSACQKTRARGHASAARHRARRGRRRAHRQRRQRTRQLDDRTAAPTTSSASARSTQINDEQRRAARPRLVLRTSTRDRGAGSDAARHRRRACTSSSAWSKVYALDARPASSSGPTTRRCRGECGVERLLRRRQPRRRGVERQGLRRHARRPADRARCGDRQAGLGRADRRQDAAATRSPARRASSKGKVIIGNGGAEYRRARLRLRLRRGDRQAGCGASTPCPAIRRRASRTPALEMAAADLDRRVVEARRRRHGVGLDRLRPGARPRLHRHRQRLAVESQTCAARAAATTCSCRSIVALNADTGEYVWHYQTMPGRDLGLHRDAADHARGPDDRRPRAQGDHAGAEERLLLRARPRRPASCISAKQVRAESTGRRAST